MSLGSAVLRAVDFLHLSYLLLSFLDSVTSMYYSENQETELHEGSCTEVIS